MRRLVEKAVSDSFVRACDEAVLDGVAGPADAPRRYRGWWEDPPVDPAPHGAPGASAAQVCGEGWARPRMVEYEPGEQSCSHWGLFQVYPVRIYT